MSTRSILGLCSLLLAGSAAAVHAQTAGDPTSCMGTFWGGGWGHMFFGGFMMLFFWAGLVALIALAVRWVTSGAGDVGTMSSSARIPRQILEERFARGEIDKQEFEDRKKALGA